MHRGHWNEASGSDVLGGLSRAPGDSLPATSPFPAEAPRGRIGKGDTTDCLLVALFMAAFSTCVNAGLIPHARQGGRGVRALAVAGSKFEGTGFEKLQMVQTHVAELAGDGSTGAGLRGLSDRGTGEELLSLGEPVPVAGDLDCNEDRFVGLGIKVTLAEDLRKPACGTRSQQGDSTAPVMACRLVLT